MHDRLDLPTATHFVEIVLTGIEREFPNHVMALLTDEKDVERPRDRTPAFFGCFDWHSSVHSHWCLVRLRRFFPDAPWIPDVEAVLARRLSEENLAGERRFLTRPGNERFECPYGLAWLLQLAAEMRASAGEPDSLDFLRGRGPERFSRMKELERLARDRLLAWVTALPFPVRSGQHPQSAFAMGLAHDWATAVGDDEFATLLAQRTRAFHQHDRNGPLAYEPGGYDFVSPCLAESDLIRRVMDPIEFAAWLRDFLPGLPEDERTRTDWLRPVVCPDPSDGKLSHLDGLNLSRAWMLDGIVHALPVDDPRQPALLAAAAEHGSAGLDAVTGEHYAGAHWLPSFATYLLTRRGIGS